MTIEDQIVFKARGKFIEELPRHLGAIEDELSRLSLEPEDAFDSICLILHQVKGGAGFFGFENLVSEIRHFELISKGGDTRGVVELKKVLEPIMTLLKATIDEL